jgi:hypothetical protein
MTGTTMAKRGGWCGTPTSSTRRGIDDMVTDFDRLVYLVETLRQEVLTLSAVVGGQNEQLKLVAALVSDLMQSRETERAQFAALLQQSVETTGAMVTNLEQRVVVAFQVVQQDLDVLMGRQ